MNDEGCAVAGPFATSAEAQGLLQDGTPDLALLDLDFEPANGFVLAQALHARRVPVVLLTSSGREGSLPESLVDLVRVAKPARMQTIRDEFAKLLRQGPKAKGAPNLTAGFPISP